MKIRMAVVFSCALVSTLCADHPIENLTLYQPEGTPQSIVSGSVSLPSDGWWSVDFSKLEKGSIRSPFIFSEIAADQFEGRRMKKIRVEKSIHEARWSTRSIAYRCRNYAREHSGSGPASLSDLDDSSNSDNWNYFLDGAWENLPENKKDGPFNYLVPNAVFEFEDAKGKWGNATNHTVLAFELRPYINDGKHFVSYTDGQCERELIDEALLKKHGQTIRPVFTQEELFPEVGEMVSYDFIVALSAFDRGELSLPLTNIYTRAETTLFFNPADAETGDEELKETLREYQSTRWFAYGRESGSPVLQAWLATIGDGEALSDQSDRGDTTSAFGIMGGFAAVRETLQMQLIGDFEETTEANVVAMDSIQGVQVESHPYEEMLGDSDGHRLQLAESVPVDRFFVYLAKPEALLPILNSGADFISQLGSSFTGNNIKYNLKERYLKRFGVNEKWLELFLKSGGVSECACIMSDLFLIDGTDITILARLARPEQILPMLKMLGIAALPESILEIKNTDGQSVYWTIHKDLLVVGTSSTELENVLQVGADSLGNSAEFRYMLTQLPLNEQTRAYAYCSDPFIRQLVGPETKIGQLRRVKAMAKLQELSAAALLARLDGFDKMLPPEQLKELGYLRDTFMTDDYSIDHEGVSFSQIYGRLGQLRSLTSLPIKQVSTKEEAAYESYVENYSRFWSQFFDPIALRIDDGEDRIMEASLFILPLIDNSIYDAVREVLMVQESGVPLRIPQIEPEPVLQFSLNLLEEAWVEIGKELDEMLEDYVSISPAILDDLGPAVHIMIHDADPVIAMGSGDLFGAFGGNNFSQFDMIIPVALSVLTRPCTIAVETSNPEMTINYLREAANTKINQRDHDFMCAEIYQVGDADSWVCVFDIMGTIRLRYGLEVHDNYLMIRNIPWSNKDRILKVETAELNGAFLRAAPGAGTLQLPSLHATANEKSRKATLQGLGLLYPLVESGAISIEDAKTLHMKLFGYTPYQQPGDRWTLENRELTSSRYGSVFNKRQDAYQEDDTEFGLLQVLDSVEVQMQFEANGLRTFFRWKNR